MSTRPVHLASDVHLGAIPPERERAFLAWLEHTGREAGTLVMNGDLFDFWFEYRSAIPRGHTRVLGALAALVDAGIDVHLTGGNHDWWGGRHLREEVGVHFHTEPVELELAGRRTLVAHGDGLGPGDFGYKALKAVIRSRIFVGTFRLLHPDLGAIIAGRASSTATRTDGPGAAQFRRARVLENWARDVLSAREDLGLLTLGHTHVPARIEVQPGRWYLNSGDWVHHCTWAVLAEGHAPRLLAWDGRAAIPFEPERDA